MQVVPVQTYSTSSDTVEDCVCDTTDGLPDASAPRETWGMNREQTRLESFRHWPPWAYASPRDLAKYGFFYTSVDDQVQCFFCGLRVWGWGENQDVYFVHWLRARKYCPLIKGEHITNVPMEQEWKTPDRIEDKALVRITSHHDELEMHKTSATLANPGVYYHPASNVSPSEMRCQHGASVHNNSANAAWREILRTARCPSMMSFQARLETFTRWPLLRPSPRELAKAGLYRSPSGGQSADSVTCFSCGERLHRWRQSDDPLLEHARLSPACHFVKRVLGDMLHDDVLRAADGIEETRYVHTEPSDRSTSHAADRLLEMGFPADVVFSVLVEVPPAVDLSTLCSLALDMTEQNATSPSPTPNAVPCGHSYPGTCQENDPQSAQVSPGNQDLPQTLVGDERTSLRSSAPPAGGQRANDDKLTCKVCAEAEVKVTFQPCGHLICCLQCSQKVSRCPVCGRFIADRIVTYLS